MAGVTLNNEGERGSRLVSHSVMRDGGLSWYRPRRRGVMTYWTGVERPQLASHSVMRVRPHATLGDEGWRGPSWCHTPVMRGGEAHGWRSHCGEGWRGPWLAARWRDAGGPLAGATSTRRGVTPNDEGWRGPSQGHADGWHHARAGGGEPFLWDQNKAGVPTLPTPTLHSAGSPRCMPSE